jgi:hypothetical protein
MATSQKIIPINSKSFSIWMYVTRAAQVLVTIVVLGLDISVIDDWNKNQWSFNSFVSDASPLNLKTSVGGTPFTGIVMFTVSHPVRRTLIL